MFCDRFKKAILFCYTVKSSLTAGGLLVVKLPVIVALEEVSLLRVGPRDGGVDVVGQTLETDMAKQFNVSGTGVCDLCSTYVRDSILIVL